MKKKSTKPTGSGKKAEKFHLAQRKKLLNQIDKVWGQYQNLFQPIEEKVNDIIKNGEQHLTTFEVAALKTISSICYDMDEAAMEETEIGKTFYSLYYTMEESFQPVEAIERQINEDWELLKTRAEKAGLLPQLMAQVQKANAPLR